MNFLSKDFQENQDNIVVKLGDLFKFVKGKKPKDIKEINQKDHVPYLVKKYIDNGEVSYVHCKDGIFIEDLDVFMLMDGANSGNIYYGYQGILGSTFSLLENEHDLINEYLYWYLLINQDSIKKQNTGSAIPHLGMHFVLKFIKCIGSTINI